MGLWAAYVLIETEVGPEAPAGWVTATGASAGWSAYTARSVDPDTPGTP